MEKWILEWSPWKDQLQAAVAVSAQHLQATSSSRGQLGQTPYRNEMFYHHHQTGWPGRSFAAKTIFPVSKICQNFPPFRTDSSIYKIIIFNAFFFFPLWRAVAIHRQPWIAKRSLCLCSVWKRFVSLNFLFCLFSFEGRKRARNNDSIRQTENRWCLLIQSHLFFHRYALQSLWWCCSPPNTHARTHACTHTYIRTTWDWHPVRKGSYRGFIGYVTQLHQKQGDRSGSTEWYMGVAGTGDARKWQLGCSGFWSSED